MKKIILAATSLLLSISFISCKKDKNTDTTFTGTWDLATVHSKYSVDGITIDDTTGQLDAGYVTYTFNEDKTYSNTNKYNPADTGSGWYERDASTLTFIAVDHGDTFRSTSNWSISGKQLTLYFVQQEVVTGSVYKDETTLLLNKL